LDSLLRGAVTQERQGLPILNLEVRNKVSIDALLVLLLIKEHLLAVRSDAGSDLQFGVSLLASTFLGPLLVHSSISGVHFLSYLLCCILYQTLLIPLELPLVSDSLLTDLPRDEALLLKKLFIIRLLQLEVLVNLLFQELI